MMELSWDLQDYLGKWYKTTKANKEEQGVRVDLTLQEFIALFDKRQLKSLQKAIDEDRLHSLQDAKSAYAYVATWRSYDACSTRVWDKNTAMVCSRMKSSKLNLPTLGSKLRPEHRAKIAQTLTGKAKTPEHRQAISDATKGGTKTAWTPERVARRKADLAAKKAK